VVLVEAHEVVEVAADVAGGAEEGVEVDGADLREDLGEKILLELGGEAQLFVEAGHVELERLIAAAEDVELGLDGFELVVKRIGGGEGVGDGGVIAGVDGLGRGEVGEERDGVGRGEAELLGDGVDGGDGPYAAGVAVFHELPGVLSGKSALVEVDLRFMRDGWGERASGVRQNETE
jgi:hypothetical protein